MEHSKEPRFGTACVLAGGRGTRMLGLDKLQLEYSGERLLGRIARQLRTRFSDVVAVTSRPDAFDGLGFRVVADVYAGAGPLAGLHAGLLASRSEWLYLVACDMPFFSAAWVDALELAVDDAWADCRRPVVAAARDAAYFQPFHAMYHNSLVRRIESALSRPGGKYSMQSMIGEVPSLLLEADGLHGGVPSLFHNLNTPRDLAAIDGGDVSRSIERVRPLTESRYGTILYLPPVSFPRPAGWQSQVSTREGVHMSKTVIATTSAPAAIGPYSQAIKSLGNLVFCSGQLGLDPATGELADGVRAQAERSVRNLKAVAEAAGGSLENVVKTTIFLKNMADFAAVNEVYGSFFPTDKPARSTVEVAGLPKGGLVEIEVILSL